MTSPIEDRIAGRQHAEEFIQLVNTGSDAYRAAAAAAMRFYADSVIGKPPTEFRVMTEAESAAFESNVITFGKHQGKAFIDVPIDYLAWIADSALTIAAYLRSQRGLRRLVQDSETPDHEDDD